MLGVVEEEAGLGELELDELRCAVRGRDEIDPRVRQGLGGAHGRRDRGEHLLGDVELGRGRCPRRDDLALVAVLTHPFAAFEQGPLADAVREPATEEDQGGLAVAVDGGHVGLHHHGAPGGDELLAVGVDLIGVAPASGVLRATRDARLDHPLLGVGEVVAAAHVPAGVDHGHAGRRELTEIDLVGVPGQDVGGVEQPRHLLGPPEEGVATVDVVPAGPDHDDVVGRPVHVVVVPHGDLGVEPACLGGADQQGEVDVERCVLSAGGERDGHGCHCRGAGCETPDEAMHLIHAR